MSPTLVAIRGREQQPIPLHSKPAFPICSLGYWQPYFTVETADIRKRLYYSLNPRRTTAFIEEINCKPDLYGPLWISGALVFFSIICSTADMIFTRLFFEAGEKNYVIDYQVLGFIFSIVYGFLFGFGLFATIWLKFLGVDTSFVKVLFFPHSEPRHLRLLAHDIPSSNDNSMDRHRLVEDNLHGDLRFVFGSQTSSDLLLVA